MKVLVGTFNQEKVLVGTVDRLRLHFCSRGSIAALEETLTTDLGLCLAESEWEHRLLARRMRELGAVSVWTSGHVCDRRVSPRCYTQPELQPRIVFGWFWAGTGRPLHPTNSTPDR